MSADPSERRARSLVCAIDLHHKCDGGAPNGPARRSDCVCWCHEDVTLVWEVDGRVVREQTMGDGRD